VGRELRTRWPALAVIAVVAAAVAFARMTGWNERGIRYGGTWLEVCGVIAVAIQLSGLRRHFAHPTLAQLVKAWYGRVRKAGKRTVVKGHGSVDFGMTVHGVGEMRLSPGASIEQRLAWLEEQLRVDRQRAWQLADEFAAAKKSFEDAQRTSEQQNASGHASNRKFLEDVMLGDFHVDVIGLVFVAIGGLCANLSHEVAGLLARL